MKYNRTEVLKCSLYVMAVSLFFELYLSFIAVIVNNNTIKEVKNVLIAAPLLFGPSLGYGIYKIIKYRKRIKTDLEFRRQLIIRTTAEIIAILIPLYILAVFLKLVKY
ncbi:heme/copper-type cytochrome/quinol oxidase subunit 2 [Clostridium pascui]|uniref:hypothetical protein n=1 Tax=Clostridium pascui TaxID=46609 RepID=UPI00195CCB92|nr:hypothetical protein [Clostridium pascui]MBM7871485.1 heme/copper-type cytochrome/quinol oxidase subunit 2 [Clostridium pascui]